MKCALIAASMLVAAPAMGATFTPDNQSIVIDGSGVAHVNIPLRISTTSSSIATTDMAGVVNYSGANLIAGVPVLPKGSVAICNYDSTPLTLNPSTPIKGYSASTLPGLNNGSASCLNLTSDGTQWWAMAIIPGGSGGTATPPPTNPPPTTTDTLVLQMSEDYWQTDAQFNVYLDGTKLNPIVLVATAIHGQGTTPFMFSGTWGPGPHTLGIEFLNDMFAGPGLDINLYLNSATYDGVMHNGGLSLYTNGLQTLIVP